MTHLESCYSDGESFKTCSFLPELAAGKSLAREDKGRGVTHLGSRYSDGESFETCPLRPELAAGKSFARYDQQLWRSVVERLRFPLPVFIENAFQF